MELNLRTVLVVLGALVMLGILFDGFRRMQRSRKEALNLDVKEDFKFPEASFSSELPNGGARVVGERDAEELLEDVQKFRDQLDDFPGISALDQLEDDARSDLDSTIQESLLEERTYAGEPDFQHESYDSVQKSAPFIKSEMAEKNGSLEENKDFSEKIIPEFEKSFSGNDTQANADVFEDNISADTNGVTFENSGISEIKEESALNIEADKSPESFKNTEPLHDMLIPKAKPLNLDEHVPLLMDVEELGDEIEPQIVQKEEVSADEAIELSVNDISGIEASVAGISEMLAPKVAAEPFSSNVPEIETPEVSEGVFDDNEGDGRQEAAEMMAEAAYAPVKKPGPNAKSISDRPAPSLVLVTHVVPHDEEGFCGEDILYLVNSCDLRHGEKDIFHRYEQEGGEGHIQFSMAQSFNPGIFNPETLLHERIHGVSLFMSLPGPDKAMDAFEAMTEMASVIARNLGGDVHDETHSIMALQTIEHNRQQVRDFVRKQKIAEKK